MRKENHWIGHSLTDTERNRERLPFQRFAERRRKFPLGGEGESPRGRGIGRCGIGDYGIEKLSSIGQNGDDGEFLLKKTHLIFRPESAISLKIFIFLKTHFNMPLRKRELIE